jgi:multidrug efflux pump subunit AcrB
VAEIVEGMRAEVEALMENAATPGKVTFTMISGGPPVEKPVKVRVRNDEPQELRAAGDALLAIVRAVPGAKDVADDDIPGRPELVLALDRGALRAAGLDAGKVARLLRLHADGEIVAMMRDKGEKARAAGARETWRIGCRQWQIGRHGRCRHHAPARRPDRACRRAAPPRCARW